MVSDRLMNRLCTTALIVGMTDVKQILEESSVRKAISDLDQAWPSVILLGPSHKVLFLPIFPLHFSRLYVTILFSR